MDFNRINHNIWAVNEQLPQDNYTNTVIYHEKNGVGLLLFRPFMGMNYITHGFSTRIGGVSRNEFATMNLSFSRGDDKEAVSTNFKLMADALDTTCDNMVMTHQTHTANVLEATPDMGGMGITRPLGYSDIDGLITHHTDICLVTSYADCVPLYFVDTRNRVIGLSHSGWRGTAANICRNTVNKMEQLYNSQPEDIVTFIGPSICNECYEVSSDLLEPFGRNYSAEEMKKIFQPKDNGKFQLNLHYANFLNMKKAGIPTANIYVTDVCTCCNSDVLFSHRQSNGKRGGLCGFLGIKE